MQKMESISTRDKVRKAWRGLLILSIMLALVGCATKSEKDIQTIQVSHATSVEFKSDEKAFIKYFEEMMETKEKIEKDVQVDRTFTIYDILV